MVGCDYGGIQVCVRAKSGERSLRSFSRDNTYMKGLLVAYRIRGHKGWSSILSMFV